MPELRRKGFRLGTWHGKIPTDLKSEYAIQRALYLHGVCLVPHRDPQTHIHLRPIGYEMPLYRASRDKSVDVVAYDRQHNIYLIEVKQAQNSQRLAEVIKQVNDYAGIFEQIKKYVQAEFNEQFHVSVEFKRIVKLIVAPRKFYKKDENLKFLASFHGDVWVGFLGRIPAGAKTELLWKKSGPISIHLHHVPADTGLGTTGGRDGEGGQGRHNV